MLCTTTRWESVMNQAEATHVARLLEQFHDLFGFAAAAFLPANANVTVAALMRQLNTRTPTAGRRLASLRSPSSTRTTQWRRN
jgi:hypothetical protein